MACLFFFGLVQLRAQLRTVTTDDLFLCTPKSVTLNTSPTGGTTPYTYTWSPAATLSSTTAPNPTASPVSTTTYYVTITDGASNSIQDSVTVNIGSFPPDVAAFPESDTICAGDTIQLDLYNDVHCVTKGSDCITSSSVTTIGSGILQSNSSGISPYHVNQVFFFGSRVRSNKRQLIYKKSELNAMGITNSTNFTSLAFFTTSFLASWTYQNFTIKMGCITDSAFSTLTYMTGLETVFDPKTVTVTSGSKWTTHTFDRPFAWDGESNIVVEICFNNPGDIGFNGPTVRFEAADPRVVMHRTGASDVCGFTMGTAHTHQRPHIQFNHCNFLHRTPVTLSWSPAAGLSSTTIPNPTAAPSATTDYIITVTDTNGCVGTDTSRITVAPNFTITPTPDSTLCVSDSFNLAAIHNGGAGASYSWSPASIIGNPTAANTKAFIAGATTIDLMVTSAAGCERSDTFVVDIAPAIDLEILTPDTSICQGDSLFIDVRTDLLGCSISPTPCANTSEVTSGTMAFALQGVTTSPFGVNGTTSNSQRKQVLFRQSDFAALGITDAATFQSLAINISTFAGTTTFENFTIKMGCTDITEFAFFPSSDFVAGTQTVLNPTTVTISSGWNTYAFDNGFTWDGTSNVIVEFCFENSSPLSFITDNQSVWSTAAGFAATASIAGTSVCGNNTPSFVSFFRPDMRFAYCEAPPRPDLIYSWSPAAGVNNTALAEPTVAPATNTSYIVTATNPANACEEQDTIQVDVAPNYTITTTPDTLLCAPGGLGVFVNHTSPSPTVFSWEPSALFSNPTIAAPTANINQTELLEITVHSNGCTKRDTVNVALAEALTAQASVTDEKICLGNTTSLEVELNLSCGPSGLAPCATPSLAKPVTGTVSSLSSSNVSLFLNEALATKRQYLFRATELDAAGMNQSASIHSIAFNITTLGFRTLYRSFSIKVGCIVQGTLSPTYVTGLTTVFDTKDITITAGVNTLDFDRGYNWDGASNLVVEICYTNTGFPSPFLPNSAVEYTSPGFPATIVRNANNTICSFTTGTPLNVRPTIEFGYCTFIPNVGYSWTPSSSLNDTAAQNPIATPDSTTLYRITTTDLNTGCTYDDSVEVVVSDFTVAAMPDTTVCYAEGFQLAVQTDATAPVVYQWLPTSELNDSSLASPTITVEGGNQYVVSVTDSSGCTKLDTTNVFTHPAPTIETTADTTICKSDDLILFATGGVSYLWTPDQFLNNGSVSAPVLSGLEENTLFLVTITDANNCERYDSVRIDVFPSSAIELGKDTSLCKYDTRTLDAGSGFQDYLWQDGSKLQTQDIVPPGEFHVEATDNFGCKVRDTITYGLYPTPASPLDPHYFVCENDSLVLDALNSGSSYSWSTGATSRTIALDSGGVFWVKIFNDFCQSSDTFKVTGLPFPVSELPAAVSYCENELPYGIPVRAGSDEYIYHWSNGRRVPEVELAEPGLYTVEISNGENCRVLDTVVVTLYCETELFAPNSFTPNNDGINDFFSVTAINVFDFNVQIFDRWGKLIYESPNTAFQWDGTSNGKVLSQGVYVWRITYDQRNTDGSFTEKDEFGQVLLIR
jgi:gliding motility-associated-like protein